MLVGLKRQNLEELFKGIYLDPVSCYDIKIVYDPQNRFYKVEENVAHILRHINQ